MAKSYESLQLQFEKIKRALMKLTPPEPNDRFEELRTGLKKEMDKMDKFLNNQIKGDEE